MGVQEDPPEIRGGEFLGHAVTQSGGEDQFALHLVILNALQATLRDEVCCAALGVGHPGEDFGNQEADVVIDPDVRAHHPGAGEPSVVAGQREGQESGIQVDDRWKSVEGPEPAPVVEGDLPVMELMNSMNSSGSSM